MVDMSYNQTKPNIYLIYMYKEDFTLNNLEWLIYHKSKPNETTQIDILREFKFYICYFFSLTLRINSKLEEYARYL